MGRYWISHSLKGDCITLLDTKVPEGQPYISVMNMTEKFFDEIIVPLIKEAGVQLRNVEYSVLRDMANNFQFTSTATALATTETCEYCGVNVDIAIVAGQEFLVDKGGIWAHVCK